MTLHAPDVLLRVLVRYVMGTILSNMAKQKPVSNDIVVKPVEKDL